MQHPVLLAVLALASIATAQRGPAPAARPALPSAPPAATRAVLAQRPLLPLSDRDRPKNPTPAGAMPAPADPKSPEEIAIEQAITGAKVAGKDLKKAVKKVAALHWHDSTTDARAEAAATGKPMLWVHALGELDGFA